MILPSGTKPWLICPKEAGHYAMHHAYLDEVDASSDAAGKYYGTLWTTDGKRLAALRVETDAEDVPGFVTVAALKRASKMKTPLQVVRCLADSLVTLDGISELRPKDSPECRLGFPRVRAVVPAHPEKLDRVLSLDAGLLKELSDAIGKCGGKNGITIRWSSRHEGKSPLYVHHSDPGVFAVLMPLDAYELPATKNPSSVSGPVPARADE